MDDVISCLHEQRSHVVALREGGGGRRKIGLGDHDVTEEEELVALKQRMVALESHYDDFHKLSIVKDLRTFLAVKLFDSDKLRKAIGGTANGQILEAARRKVINNLRNHGNQLSDERIIMHENYASPSLSSSKKQKKGQFELFDFDDLPAYEPLENTLRLLRLDPLNDEAIGRLLDMDALELVEHPQWEELVTLLHKGLTMVNGLSEGGVTVGVATNMIQAHVKFLSAFSGQQAIDIAMNVIKYLWIEWNLNLVQQRSSSTTKPILLTPIHRLQVATFILILSSAPNHFILLADKVVDRVIAALFLLLARGSIISSVDGQRCCTHILDCVVSTMDMGRFISKYVTATLSLQVAALSLQTGLVDELGMRIASFKESEDLHHGRQDMSQHIDSLMLTLVINVRMWLVLLAPLANLHWSTSSDSDSSDTSRGFDRVPDFEIVTDMNKKFTKITGSFSVIESLAARMKGVPPPPVCYKVNLLEAFEVYAEVLLLKSQSFDNSDVEKPGRRHDDITDMCCEAIHLFVINSCGLDPPNLLLFLDKMYRLIRGLLLMGRSHGHEHCDIPAPQIQWSSTVMVALYKSLDHFICINMSRKDPSPFDDARVISLYLLCSSSVTSLGLKLLPHTTTPSLNSLCLTSTAIQMWSRILSAPPTFSMHEQNGIPILLEPLIAMLKLCIGWLKGSSGSDNSGDSLDSDTLALRSTIRRSALELVVAAANTVYSTHHILYSELSLVFKDAVNVLLLSLADLNLDSSSPWSMDAGRGCAVSVLNICSNCGATSILDLDSLQRFRTVLVEELTNPYSLESMVACGQISETMTPLFCLLDGLVFLGGIDIVMQLMVRSCPLHHLMTLCDISSTSSTSSRSARYNDKPFIWILSANPNIRSEDWGNIILDMVDIALLNIGYCLSCLGALEFNEGDNVDRSEADVGANIYREERCLFERLGSLEPAYGPYLDSKMHQIHCSEISANTLDMFQWSAVSLDSLLHCSYSMLSPDVWSLDITPITRVNNWDHLRTDKSSRIACIASGMIYEAVCRQKNGLSEIFKCLNKTQFQQLVVSCDLWSKSTKGTKSEDGEGVKNSGLIDNGDEEFDWFIGACSLSWLPESPSGKHTLPYILQFVHHSPEWNCFFGEGLKGTVERIYSLLTCRGHGMVTHLNSIGFPVRMVIKSIVQQWFFRYLSIQDIQRLTVVSILKGPDVVICTVASIIDRFEQNQRSSDCQGYKQRGMVAFKTFMSTVDMSLLALAPLIQSYYMQMTTI